MPRYAAIDIGSNSIRLLAAEIEPGGTMRILESERTVTRLGENVFRAGFISAEAMDSVSEVLARMVAAYRRHDVTAARLVATAAVRDAGNSAEFIERCSEIAGQPVEIISGQEEARLIHLGVESRWPHPQERLLIVDIGGGSAEFIEAQRGNLVQAFSRPLGAVRLHSTFLRDADPPSVPALRRLNEFIDEKLAVPLRRITHGGFARAIGTSASASAIVCAVNRIPRTRRDEADRRRATLSEIRRLCRELAGKSLEQRRKVTGIGPRRAEIIVPGAAVLVRTLEAFDVPAFYYCAAGVREGIVKDLADRGAGRERSRLDREDRSLVEQFARRFGVDLGHARKVAQFSRDLFHALETLHKLPPEFGRLLETAAYLRDVGHAISDTAHHKHSQYIVANADLASFTDLERLMVAMLCRYHRKSMPAQRHGDFQALPPLEKNAVAMLAPILRIADALDRSRDQRIRGIECTMRNGAVHLALHADRDASLEIWAVERAAGAFHQIFNRTLTVAAAAAPSDNRK
jgi:exopolyphosphatase/guanosine-5'-triphosphate,3'-diphosphate pyrophosphatase